MGSMSPKADAGAFDQAVVCRWFFDDSPAPLWVLEAERASSGEVVDWTLREANPALPKALGLRHDEVVGKSPQSLFPDSAATWHERWEQVLSTGETCTYQQALGGSEHLIRVVRVGSDLLGVTALDIVDLRRVERALRESETRFRAAADAHPFGLVLRDAQRRFVFLNTWALRRIGKALEDMLGKTDEELYPPELTCRYVPALERVIASGLPESFDFAVPAQFGGGTLSLTYTPIRNEEGVVVHVLASHWDLTEREETERKLREMALEAVRVEERARRRIAADLHDRIGQALALAKIRLGAVRESTTGEVREAVEAAERLLDESIDDARILTFEISPPVLYDLGLPAALLWLADQVKERHGLRVEVSIGRGPLPRLPDDLAAVLLRLVRKLLMNVIQHARTSEANVSLYVSGRDLCVEVNDSGIGFEPGTVAWWSRRAGFGLFSVRERVNGLGGRFELLSSEGKGTRAIVSVPLVQTGRAEAEGR
jgi:PAS domain S-box-containing protein